VTETTSIEDQVISIVCEQLSASREKVSLDSSFIQDLGADSLDQVELVMEFEEAFKERAKTEFGKEMVIPEGDAESLSTVGSAVDFITDFFAGNGPSAEEGTPETESGSEEAPADEGPAEEAPDEEGTPDAGSDSAGVPKEPESDSQTEA